MIEIQEETPVKFDAWSYKGNKKADRWADLLPNQYLQNWRKGGGCSGMSYILGFENKGKKPINYLKLGIPA